ncbi:hypothetical protein ACFYRN_44095 [Streptomyces sp. NPDC005227]|uniref:hypothetical protein n=1 Tax=unclassified Streptomyces TaxID=2593676 RepID=UPI00368DA33D
MQRRRAADPPRTTGRAAAPQRRRFGSGRWQTETVYAVTDLSAHQAGAAEVAPWARGHWIIENTVPQTKDLTFAGDAGQVRRRRTPPS